TRWNGRRYLERLERPPARNVSRRVSQQQAERVLREGAFPFDAGDLPGRGIQQLFGLANVESARDPARAARFDEPQVVVGGVSRAFRDLELEIERAKGEIRLADVGDERRDDATPRFFRRQI